MDLESTLLSLLRLRAKSRTSDLDDTEARQLADLEQALSRVAAMPIVNLLSRPDFASRIWHLIR
jgi:hypothetical protein